MRGNNRIIKEIEKNDEKKVKEVKLRSSEYNHDSELITKREEESNDAVMWGFVIGFVLFIILVIMIICFTH